MIQQGCFVMFMLRLCYVHASSFIPQVRVKVFRSLVWTSCIRFGLYMNSSSMEYSAALPAMKIFSPS